VAPVTVNAENAQVLICDERRRTELIQQRERLLALEADSERKIETALPVPLPRQETHLTPTWARGMALWRRTKALLLKKTRISR
jgi:hypothetical protein